jgi:hypothetical protein
MRNSPTLPPWWIYLLAFAIASTAIVLGTWLVMMA